MTRKSFIFSALSLFSLLLFGCGPVSCKCGCEQCKNGCECSPEKKCSDKNCHCDK